jgi:hypothetical protein
MFGLRGIEAEEKGVRKDLGGLVGKGMKEFQD